MTRFLILPAICLLVTSLSAVHADIVFQADFNGDDLSGTDTPGDPSDDAVTVGGMGSSYVFRAGETTAATVTGSPLSLNEGGYLQMNRDAGIDAGGNAATGMQLSPDGPGNWLNSWYTNDGGNDTLVGSYDFLYRQNADFQGNNTFDFDFTGASSTNGIRVRIKSNSSNSLFMGVFIDSPTDTQNVTASGSFDLEADQLYHIAVVFDGPAGATVGRLFVKAGDEAIDPDTDTPVVETSPFDVDEFDDLTQSFDSTPGTATRLTAPLGNWDSYEPEATVDIDRFRIWNEVPDEIPGVVPEPSSMLPEWSITNTALVLAWSGGGTSILLLTAIGPSSATMTVTKPSALWSDRKSVV